MGMQIVHPESPSRSFLMQMMQVMEEFGSKIPWLNPLHEVQFSTDSVYFEKRLLGSFGCIKDQFLPSQIVTDDAAKTFIGGIFHFRKTPEVFSDQMSLRIVSDLESVGASYISCLQVRGVHRGQSHGDMLMRHSLTTITETFGKVWGVVEDQTLLPWYESLGMEVLNEKPNLDGLWFVTKG